jgi:hypothetical protein
MLFGRTLFAAVLFILFSIPALGQADDKPQVNTGFLEQFKLSPPQNFRAQDTPDDNGGSITLRWELSREDNLWGKKGLVERYIISRRIVGEEQFEVIVTTSFHSNMVFDNNVDNSKIYEYQVSVYPFKYIFRPILWKETVIINQIERFKLISPWFTLNPQGTIMSLLSQDYDYFKRLDGYKSDLVTKSVWQNLSPNSELTGPSGLASAWIHGQIMSPLGPFVEFFAQSSVNPDPYQFVTLGKYLREGILSSSEIAGPVKATKQWLNMSRFNVLIMFLILSFLILYYIDQAKRGKKLFIRRIAGLEAVDEAVGRATEMGKEIFYIPGTQDMENIQTIAGVTILGRVARLAAQYETRIEVPVSRSLVMVTAREIVKEAYMKEGRPDAFQENQVHYLTDDQFGYAAAIDGKMVRQKPATIFYMGAFYAESLILAETGNSIGAIQIAGTAMPAQLPFFVAACDYTLIGEELFAASAYLSKEPKLLGSVKGQDVGKGLIILALAVGVIVQTFGWFDFASLFN